MERILDPQFVADRTDSIQSLLYSRFGFVAGCQSLTGSWLSQPEVLRELQSLLLRLRYPIQSTPAVTLSPSTV